MIKTIFVLMSIAASAINCSIGSEPVQQISSNNPASTWVWGPPTNGIVAGILVQEHRGNATVSIYVHQAFDSKRGFPNLKYEPDESQQHVRIFGEPLENGTSFKGPGYYCAPSNGFCGPIELRDGDGNSVPPIRPELSTTEAYPSLIKTTPTVEEQRQLKIWNGGTLWKTQMLVGRMPELTHFDLKDQFRIQKSGKFLFTVWPKVYKRQSNESDFFSRMDLPPIHVEINLQPGTGSSIQDGR